MIVFPQVRDWYLQWREQRRGIYTRWETGHARKLLRTLPVVRRVNRTVGGVMVGASVAVVTTR